MKRLLCMTCVASVLLAGVLVGSAGANGIPPEWNAHAEWFMYAPSFAFREIPGAVRYRFRTIDDCHVIRAFTADRPSDSLAPVWEELPTEIHFPAPLIVRESTMKKEKK